LNLEVFCYVGLLRFPEQLEPSLSLLPDAEKAEAAKLLESLRVLSRSELLQRWTKLRDEELILMRRELSEKNGVDLDKVPPSLLPWCISWWADQNG
jgi:hypothetical protein